MTILNQLRDNVDAVEANPSNTFAVKKAMARWSRVAGKMTGQEWRTQVEQIKDKEYRTRVACIVHSTYLMNDNGTRCDALRDYWHDYSQYETLPEFESIKELDCWYHSHERKLIDASRVAGFPKCKAEQMFRLKFRVQYQRMVKTLEGRR